jgi:hypothetical protein
LSIQNARIRGLDDHNYKDPNSLEQVIQSPAETLFGGAGMSELVSAGQKLNEN